MPIVEGVGDEVLCAALAAAAAPLAIALSPSYIRRKPLTLLQSGATSVAQALRLLWAKVRLWLLRRTQRVLKALAATAATESRAVERLTAAQRLSSSGAASQSLRASLLSPGAPDSCPWRDACGAVELAEGEDFASSLDKEEGSVHAEVGRYFGSVHGSDKGSTRGSLNGSIRAAAAAALGKGSKRGLVCGEDEPGLPGPPASEFCAVCHDDFTLPCQANCGHWFCAECILSVWNHASGAAPCLCPICRQAVTALDSTNATSASSAPFFCAADKGSSESGAIEGGALRARRSSLLAQVAKYNRLFGGVPVSFWQRMLDMPLLVGRAGQELLEPANALSLLHNVRFGVCVVGGGVYALSPFKIPSKGLLSLLGYVDDAVFVACVAFYLNVLYRAVAPLGAARSAPAQQAPAQQEEPVMMLDDSHLH